MWVVVVVPSPGGSTAAFAAATPASRRVDIQAWHMCCSCAMLFDVAVTQTAMRVLRRVIPGVLSGVFCTAGGEGLMASVTGFCSDNTTGTLITLVTAA